MTHWTKSYFETGYLQRWSLSPPTERHHDEASWLLEQMRSSDRAAPILDIACGHGAYTVALATAAKRVVGLDCSAALLRKAAAIADATAAPVDWVRADYRALPIASAIAGGSLLRDALGFFDDDADNTDVIREVRRTLRPKGRLVLVVVNAVPIRDHFEPTAEQERGSIRIRIERQLFSGPLRMVERVELEDHGVLSVHERRQRLYTTEELEAILRRTGFELVALHGDCLGAPFVEPSSPKSVLVAAA
jgi:ubiquinone/menaquinone biosynthesis C-methylase UbiE